VLDAFVSRNPKDSATFNEDEKDEYFAAYYDAFIQIKDSVLNQYEQITNTQKLKCLKDASRYMNTLSIEQSIFDVLPLLSAHEEYPKPPLNAGTLTYSQRWEIVQYIKNRAPTEGLNLKGIFMKYFVVDYYNMPKESLSA
jgi:hypothetical protein